ncbi:MAG: alpha/beta hydrolase [Myxococcota bacterium]
MKPFDEQANVSRGGARGVGASSMVHFHPLVPEVIITSPEIHAMTDPIVVQDLELEVNVWDDEPTTLFGRWYAHPEALEEIGGPAALLVCLPGGTYDHAYFDLDIPGDEYSFARWMAERGYVVLALDSLGTGRSTRPVAHEVGFAEMACATAEAVAAIRERVPPGTPIVAVGHSMGGYHAVVQQAAVQTYDALVVLGTTLGVVGIVPLPDEIVDAARSGPEARAGLIDAMSERFPEPYTSGDRSMLIEAFHAADVPEAVLAADGEQTTTVVPRRASAESLVPWFASEAAAAVDVPVFLGYGEIDVSLDPHAEPAYFSGSDDVTLFVLRGSAHCHNMASTRHVLWERLEQWIGSVV